MHAIFTMFGVSPPSSYSPVLRRAGSKPVFSDQGSIELVVDNGEGFSFPTALNETKNGSIPLHAAAIMPSPILLWRFKILLFLFWGISCCKISWESVMRMSADLRALFIYEAFLYYNPLLLVTMTVWLWGVNLWVFAQSSVNYSKVFDLDHNHLTNWEIWKCATWMTVVVPLSMTAYLYLYSHGEVSLAASQPVSNSSVWILTLRAGIMACRKNLNCNRFSPNVIMYAAIVMILVFPFDIFYLSSRYYFLRTLWRIILPLQAITFADFFVADILTSMSKVFSDLERSVCRMVNKQVATIAWFEADSICGSHSVAIPLVLVFPYLCRFFQCLRQYKDTKEKTCLFNALKYSTAIPVIFLSALKYHVLPDKWTNFYRPLWLLSSVVNSLYSFYWDITRDWDLSILSRIFKFKNPSFLSSILYGRMWVYYWVMGSNLILRCTWTYKLSAHLRHNYLTVFSITALEILRRFQWIFFRVENEGNKMTAKQSMELSMTEMPKEEDRLLGSDNHNV